MTEADVSYTIVSSDECISILALQLQHIIHSLVSLASYTNRKALYLSVHIFFRLFQRYVHVAVQTSQDTCGSKLFSFEAHSISTIN